MNTLDNLIVYQKSMELAEKIWRSLKDWDEFHKQTLGKQLIRAVDSIAANISEGYGRYSFKENRLFCYYSRGSLFETKTWITKAKNRNLFSKIIFDELADDINEIGKMLNAYIKSIGINSNDQLTND